MGTPTTVWEAGQTPINSAKGLVRKGTAGSLYCLFPLLILSQSSTGTLSSNLGNVRVFRLLRNGYY
jgi:hypothetical protein